MSTDARERARSVADGGGFSRLGKSYRDPLADAREAHRQGQAVIGLAGAATPSELALAAGCLPARIAPTLGRPTPTADIYMDDVISPETKSLFEAAVTGELAFLDLLVLSRAEEKLYYYLKEMVRLGRAPLAPRLHMFDLMPSRREAVRQYNRDNLDWLVDAIERAAGRKIAGVDIAQAAALTNRSRALQRRLMELRWAGKVSGSDALQAIGAGYFLHPEPYALALLDWLDGLDSAPPPPGGPRLLLATSEPFSHTRLHERIEAAGGFVVAEDDQWGARAPGGDIAIGDDMLGAILAKYWLDTAHGAVDPPEAREAWLLQHAARDDIDGIVFYIPPSDRQFGWDYPRLERQVAARGKPSLLLRRDATGDDAIDAEITVFVGQLRSAGMRP